jgi:Protein of unknown function (DUF4058)
VAGSGSYYMNIPTGTEHVPKLLSGPRCDGGLAQGLATARPGDATPDAQTILANIRAVSARFAQERSARQRMHKHELYRRARFDLRLDYTQPPVPPLAEADRAWAQELVIASGLGR